MGVDRLRRMSGAMAAFQSFCSNTSMHGWSFIGDIQNIQNSEMLELKSFLYFAKM